MRLRDLIGQDRRGGAPARGRGGPRAARLPVRGPARRRQARRRLGLALALTARSRPARLRHCESCRRIEAGLHPDVPSIRPPGRPDRHRAGTGDRRAGADAAARGAGARDHHRRRRPPERQRGEQPAQDAGGAARGNHIVLCTSAPDRMLPTIRSRVQRIRFRALTAEALVAHRRRARPPRGARRRRRRAGRRLGGAHAAGGRAPRTTRSGRSRAREALRAARARVAAPGVGRIFDAAAAVAGDKENKAALPPLMSLLGRPLPRRDGDRGGRARAGAVRARGRPQALARAGARAGCARWRRSSRPSGAAANMNPALALERLLLEIAPPERSVRAAAR